MNKKYVLILITFVIIIVLFSYIIYININKVNNDNISMPKRVPVVLKNNMIEYADLRLSLWQYPKDDGKIGSMTSSLISPQVEVANIKKFMSDKKTIQNVKTMELDISGMPKELRDTISIVSLTIFNDNGKVVVEKELIVNNNKIKIDLNNIETEGIYYAQVDINSSYGGFAKYNFKIQI